MSMKKWKLFLGILAGYIIFHRPIEILLENTIIKLVLAYIESIWYNDIIFYIAIFISFLFFFRRFRNYQIAPITLIFSVCFILIYFFYRIISDRWTFTRFITFSFIAYSDLFLILAFENLLFALFPHVRKVAENSIGTFLNDQPLSEKSHDLLGHAVYAKQIAEKINKSHFSNAFAIGINGKWGSGKTSFINLIRTQMVRKKQLIEVEFNAWNSITPQAIVKDFFDNMLEKIGPFHSSIPRLFSRYSDKLVEFHKNSITETLQTVTSIVNGSNTVQDLFDEIDDALRKIDKKIIIYIDDIDRLNKEEILEIIRLIRNTANFTNTFFIVAYDRNYIVQALMSNNSYNAEQFLEKIFQLEVTLPYFDQKIIQDSLVYKLKQNLPTEFHFDIENALFGTNLYTPINLQEWIVTMRDVTRLVNSVSLNCANILGEINFRDFISIEMLRLKYPSIYELLYSKTGRFLTAGAIGNQDITYRMTHIKGIETNQEKSETVLQTYLEENAEALSVPKNDINKVTRFIKSIFPQYPGMRNRHSHLSIIIPSRFKIYFAYSLLESQLSEVDFLKARNFGLSNFKEKIDSWYQQGLTDELIKKFAQMNTYDSHDDFEKMIQAYFYFIRKLFKGVSNFVGFNPRDLLNKMTDFEGQISDTYYRDFDGREGYHFFVRSLFEEAIMPYYFERFFIMFFIEHENEYPDFPLKSLELNKIAIGYLASFLERNTKLNPDAFDLFWSTKLVEFDSYIIKTRIPDESKRLMRDFALNRDLDSFLYFMIDIINIKKSIFGISKTIYEIFDGWKNFEEHVIDQGHIKSYYFEEFKEFYKAAKDTNHNGHFEFHFKVIPINNRIKE